MRGLKGGSIEFDFSFLFVCFLSLVLVFYMFDSLKSPSCLILVCICWTLRPLRSVLVLGVSGR